MLNIKKHYNLKIISILISVIFLFNSTLYALGDSLRVPMDRKRIETKLLIELLGDDAKLYKGLKNILSRITYTQELIPEDLEIIVTMHFKFRDYFNHNPRLNLVKIELTRDILVEIIRDLFNPFFERKGFFVVDLFAGIKKSPAILPTDELKKLGYDGKKELYIYGVDATVDFKNISTKGNTGMVRGNVYCGRKFYRCCYNFSSARLFL